MLSKLLQHRSMFMHVQLKDGRQLPAMEVKTDYVNCLINGSIQPIRKDKVRRFIGSRNMSQDSFNTLVRARNILARR